MQSDLYFRRHCVLATVCAFFICLLSVQAQDLDEPLFKCTTRGCAEYTPIHTSKRDAMTTIVITDSISFEVFYMDSGTGIGFDDAVQGPQARSIVEAVLQFVGNSLRLPSPGDSRRAFEVVIEASVNDAGQSFLAEGGSYYFPISDGFARSSSEAMYISGGDNFPGFPEMSLRVNFGAAWHFEFSPVPQGQQLYDFYSVILHELVHAMGVISHTDASGSSLFGRPNARTSFESYLGVMSSNGLIFNTDGALQVDASALTGGAGALVFISSQTSNCVVPPIIFTPNTFALGFSLQHLDGTAFPNAVIQPITQLGVTRRSFVAEEASILEALGYHFNPQRVISCSMSTMSPVMAPAMTLPPLPPIANTPTAAPDTLTLNPEADVTLYDDQEGDLANGLGTTLLAGVSSSGLRRRFAVKFDISQIPAGSIILSANLRLTVATAQVSISSFSVHNVLRNWDEGNSLASDPSVGTLPMPSDATWIHSFYPALRWTNPGGDFSQVVSATFSVMFQGLTSIMSTDEMVTDVQHWLDTGNNYGWLIKTDETSGPTSEFASAQASAGSPELVVTFQRPAPPTTSAPAVLAPSTTGKFLVPTTAPPTTMAPNGQGQGDPHFVGFRGQIFDFHGKPDMVFNLVTAPSFQMNSRFVNADLRPEKTKTYMGSVGINVCVMGDSGERKFRQLYFECDRSNQTHIARLNGRDLEPGRRLKGNVLGVKRTERENGKTFIMVGGYRLTVRFSSSKHSSCHINFKMSYRQQTGADLPHGVLGQTSHEGSNTTDFAVEGTLWDYAVKDGVFGSEFAYNQFNANECGQWPVFDDNAQIHRAVGS